MAVANRVSAADLCRKHGFRDAINFKRKTNFGGMETSKANPLGSLEDEYAKLKRLLADAMPDNVALKDLLGKMVTLATEPEAVALLTFDQEISERWTRQLLKCYMIRVRNASFRSHDAMLSDRTKAYPHDRRRFGSRRIRVLLNDEGDIVHHKRQFDSAARKGGQFANEAVAKEPVAFRVHSQEIAGWHQQKRPLLN